MVHDHPRNVSAFLVSCLCVLVIIPDLGFAQEKCLKIGAERLIETRLASAGFFANLRYSESSIHYQMDRLLENAKQRLIKFQQADRACNDTCAHPVVGISFSSRPNQSLEGYSESDKCQQLFEKTLKAPIVYGNRQFESSDAAKDWYNDLSRGAGVDGEDLYQRCDGSCSPAYSSFIANRGGNLIVTTRIICGHARDKDDDQYVLSAAIRAECSD